MDGCPGPSALGLGTGLGDWGGFFSVNYIRSNLLGGVQGDRDRIGGSCGSVVPSLTVGTWTVSGGFFEFGGGKVFWRDWCGWLLWGRFFFCPRATGWRNEDFAGRGGTVGGR